MIKRTMLAATLCATLICASCLGPNKAFNDLHEWNGELSENRWINEAIFIPLIPIYGVAYLIDIIVLNSIDWWTED